MTDDDETVLPPMVTENRAALTVGGSVAAIVPQNVEEVWRLSNVFHRSGMAPQTLNTAEKVMVAILAGAELGLAPFQAMSSFGIIGGRPVLFGDGMLAVVRSRGFRVKEWATGTDDDRTAFCEVVRPDNGETVKRSFSVADAKTAGLWKKSGPWTTNPNRMIQMRARAFACRDAAADVLRGFQMREEVEDYQEVTDLSPKRSGVGERLKGRTEQPTEGFTVENGEHLSSAQIDEILDNDNFPVANQEPDEPKRKRGRPRKEQPIETEAVVQEAQAVEVVTEGPFADRADEPTVAQSLSDEPAAPDSDASTETDVGSFGTGSESMGRVESPEALAYRQAVSTGKTMRDVQQALTGFRRSETWINATEDEQRGWQLAAYRQLEELCRTDSTAPRVTMSLWRFMNWLAAGAPGGEIEPNYEALKTSDAYRNATDAQRDALEAAYQQALP